MVVVTSPLRVTTKGKIIPARSFGNCRWCDARDVRLQYLMCTNCFSIANMVPSKVQVILNRPEVKKRLRDSGATPRAITPELYSFFMHPKTQFPSERSYRAHWERMLSEAFTFASDADISLRIEELKKEEAEIPSEQHLREVIGVEKLIYFMLKVGVLCDMLKLDPDDDEGFCVVCWKPTPSEKHMLCTQCRSDIIREMEVDEETPDDGPKQYKGMATSDIVLKNRRR